VSTHPNGARLLLVGCGHAHLFVLEALARGRLVGCAPTLVSPDDEYFYSGMVPGVLAGCYRPEDARFRPPRLAGAAGARWIRGRVTAVDVGAGRVLLEDGRALGYDLLSLDIGARLAALDTPGVAEHAVPVRPMREALALRDRIDALAAGGARASVVVVGGGAAGVEVALCLAARAGRGAGEGGVAITIVEAGSELLAERGASLRRHARRALRARGVRVRTGAAVESVDASSVRLRDRTVLPSDLTVWATGPTAPTLFDRPGLPQDGAGYLRVGVDLRVPGHPTIHGAGDCVGVDGYPGLAKAGVYAVRQGPVLTENLERALRNRSPRVWQPQRRWLSLLNLGDRRAIASYGALSLTSRGAWWLKDRIDMRFMNRFRNLER
jgi:pyridine nucleotide-disulfide oxidoreductase family protein